VRHKGIVLGYGLQWN